MLKYNSFLLLLVILYSCSPINKQHGYLLDDLLISSEKISKFELKNTTKNDIYAAMGSPSIEIDDVNNISTSEGNNLSTISLGKFETEIGIAIFSSEKRSTYNSTLISVKL